MATRPAIVAVGGTITSLAVKVTVTVSPTLARVGVALFEAIATALSVGACVSIVTGKSAEAALVLPARSIAEALMR